MQTINLGYNNTQVNIKTTAMHIAHSLYNNYCTAMHNANFKNEFSVCDCTDFAHYNVADMHDKINAYYNAFAAVQQLVHENVNATVQQAFSVAHNAAAAQQHDTVVAEEITEILNSAFTTAYNKTINSNIAADLAIYS